MRQRAFGFTSPHAKLFRPLLLAAVVARVDSVGIAILSIYRHPITPRKWASVEKYGHHDCYTDDILWFALCIMNSMQQLAVLR